MEDGRIPRGEEGRRTDDRRERKVEDDNKNINI